ncbi:MAG TPA: S1/P1 nuclease, partial [Elusimicrobiota bacterium]|nr:S1/P1 nuclease [Elusimicrobiota bacterium]
MRTPRPSLRTLSLAAAAAALLSPRASAWSANGHKTVALIAESRLSPQAKAAVAAILGPTATLDSIAPCADDIRGKTGYDCSGITLDDDPLSEPWHFINIPITDSPSDGAALDQYCPMAGSAVSAQAAPKRRRPSPSAGDPGTEPGGAAGARPAGQCVRDQINKDVNILKTSSVLADRQLALMFLVHFVGDEHQPLHCADEIVGVVNDRGGNLKNVNFEGTAMNLHALWDHQILPQDSNDPVLTSSRLIADLDGKDVSSWTSGDFVSAAALESFNIAKTVVYPAY